MVIVIVIMLKNIYFMLNFLTEILSNMSKLIYNLNNLTDFYFPLMWKYTLTYAQHLCNNSLQLHANLRTDLLIPILFKGPIINRSKYKTVQREASA